MTNREAARQAVLDRYFFLANEDEAFSVFGRQEVQDINKIRTMTDLPCLVAFLAMLVAMLTLDFNAMNYGNVMRLSEPIDFSGRLCGSDPGVEDKPLGYNPNPYNDMVVCVSACPEAAADANFTLPDGPMGKPFTRPAYPTARILGQHCLPLDLTLAKRLVTVRSVQSEVYRALAPVFSAPDVMVTILIAPLVVACIFVVIIYMDPAVATIIAFSFTIIQLLVMAVMLELDAEVVAAVPLYKEVHPLALAAQPYVRGFCYATAGCFLLILAMSIPNLNRLRLIFRECLAAVLNQNALISVFVTICVSLVRIFFMLHACRKLALLMSIVSPVEVKLQLLGQWHVVERHSWSPYFLRGVTFYVFGMFWILEFISYCNKYMTAMIICQNYFSLKVMNFQQKEIRAGRSSPLVYAVYSLVRYHLGSVAFAALVSAPCQLLRFFMFIFVPNSPNLRNSFNQQYRIAYWLFWPLIHLDLYWLRFFTDSVWVMLPLKGYTYLEAARRTEALLNRSRGKLPNLAKSASTVTLFLNMSMGLLAFFWTYFFYREPRHGRWHEAEELDYDQATGGLLETPEHLPLIVLPFVLALGLWTGNGVLHLIGMAAETLTVCYCIDVEMGGGTETDAMYVPSTLKIVYKDLGGGETERELSEIMAQKESAS